MKFFGIDINKGDDVTEEEIISMVEEGHEQGVLNMDEKEMIQNIFELSDTEASNIMTPRNNILSLDGNTTVKEALDYFLEVKKSRIPVFEENIDHILGVLHFRDTVNAYMNYENREVLLKEADGLLREAYFVPETKKIDSLFKTMQKEKIQMAIVIDEYGQTQGVLAMEDILEEIVGNIQDEYDDEEEYIHESENKDEYLIDGMTRLEELEERFDVSFGESEFETLNGYMISKLEHIPENGEVFETDVGDYCFKIVNVENKCIKTVLVKRR